MKDQKIQKLIKLEESRQRNAINLIASENYVSEDVREASASVFTNKYSEGYPGKRYYAGNKFVDELELLVWERALKLFGIRESDWGVNVQALSGVAANLFAYFAVAEPGSRMMAQALDQGGHLSHGSPVSITSKIWKWQHYQVDRKTQVLNYDDILKQAKTWKPRVIVAGASSYPRILDFKEFRKIADAVGAILLVDMAHFAGLVAAGVYPSPFPYADIVTTTTHKTLRGPRGALIFSKKECAETVNKSVFPGGQGGPHDHQTAAIGIALYEAAKPSFKKYGKQVVKNAKALADELTRLGLKLVSGGTDTHLLLTDLTNLDIDGKIAQDRLEQVGIIVNRNVIPFDTKSPFRPSGIRLGTPAITTRGMKEKEMRAIAGLVYNALTNKSQFDIKKQVRMLCSAFPVK